MRKVAENPNEKVSVTFTDFGDHVGPGSITLSSFLGVLVREHVPVTLADWRKIDAVAKQTMWEEIQVYIYMQQFLSGHIWNKCDFCLLYVMQGRFNLQEEWQRVVIFKQMGNIWRVWKSRLVSEVRAAKTVAERIDLKPSNIPSTQVWNTWVRSKTNAAFTVSYLQLTTFLFICVDIYHVGNK